MSPQKNLLPEHCQRRPLINIPKVRVFGLAGTKYLKRFKRRSAQYSAHFLRFLFDMKFSLLVLVVSAASCMAAIQNKLLRFPEELSTANYVILNPDMSSVRGEISVCTWLKKRLDMDGVGIPWFSYAVSGGDNSLLLKAQYHNVLIGSGTLKCGFQQV